MNPEELLCRAEATQCLQGRDRLRRRCSQPLTVWMTSSQHAYEVRPRKDHRGVELALPQHHFHLQALYSRRLDWRTATFSV
jgi:hypothetical protein